MSPPSESLKLGVVFKTLNRVVGKQIGRQIERGATNTFKIMFWDFSGGPVTKTLGSQCVGALGLIPGQGTRSHMPQLKILPA